MWHRTSGSNVTTYSYNAADQLTNVTATGLNASYGYDADGRRVKQTVGSAITNYLWDESSTYGDVEKDPGDRVFTLGWDAADLIFSHAICAAWTMAC
jgi:hypothetical protein